LKITNFSQLVEDLCPFGQAGLQIRPEGMDIYQTIDGFWDGIPDSTRCISAEFLGPWSGMKIALNQIDSAESVFIRFRPEVVTSIPPLQPNWLYSSSAFVDMSPDTASWQQGVVCEQGVCSGAFINIAIPDSFRTWGAATNGRGTKSLIVWSDYFEMRLGATKDCSGLFMTEAQQSISSKESNKPSKTSCPCH